MGKKRLWRVRGGAKQTPAVSLRTAEAALGPVPTTQLDGVGVFLDLPPPPPPVHVCRRYRMTEGLWGARGRVGTGPHPSPRAVPEAQESRSLGFTLGQTPLSSATPSWPVSPSLSSSFPGGWQWCRMTFLNQFPTPASISCCGAFKTRPYWPLVDNPV